MRSTTPMPLRMRCSCCNCGSPPTKEDLFNGLKFGVALMQVSTPGEAYHPELLYASAENSIGTLRMEDLVIGEYICYANVLPSSKHSWQTSNPPSQPIYSRYALVRSRQSHGSRSSRANTCALVWFHGEFGSREKK